MSSQVLRPVCQQTRCLDAPHYFMCGFMTLQHLDLTSGCIIKLYEKGIFRKTGWIFGSDA